MAAILGGGRGGQVAVQRDSGSLAVHGGLKTEVYKLVKTRIGQVAYIIEASGLLSIYKLWHYLYCINYCIIFTV